MPVVLFDLGSHHQPIKQNTKEMVFSLKINCPAGQSRGGYHKCMRVYESHVGRCCIANRFPADLKLRFSRSIAVLFNC